MWIIDPLFSVVPLQIELAKFLYLYAVVKLYMVEFFFHDWNNLSENLCGTSASDTFYIIWSWLVFNAEFLYLVDKFANCYFSKNSANLDFLGFRDIYSIIFKICDIISPIFYMFSNI